MKIVKDDFVKYFAITKISFATLGLLVYKRRQPVSKLKEILNNLLFLIAFTVLTLTIIGEVTYLLKSLSINALDVTHVLPCICYCTLGLVKLGAVASKLKKTEELLNDLEDLWPTGLNDIKTKLVTDSLGQGDIAKNVFTIINIIFMWTFNVSSLIVLIVQYVKTGLIVKTLPYYIYSPFDTTGTFVYPFAYLFHIAAGYVASIGFVAPDTFFISTISHICTQFKLLQSSIQNLVEDLTPWETNSSISNQVYHQRMYDALIECIKCHEKLISLTETIEEIFSLSILVNFVGSSIMICCVGYQSLTVTGIQVVVFVMFLVVSLIQTYVLSWAGNYLIETSTQISDAAYNSSWYIMDKKYRQLIQIMMQRAQRPQMITALRFSVVSLRSFASILSTSWSYFTLLQTAYTDK